MTQSATISNDTGRIRALIAAFVLALVIAFALPAMGTAFADEPEGEEPGVEQEGEGQAEEGLDISTATVDPIADQPYTGKAIEPKPVVTLDGKTLTEGTDYELSYTDNTAVGTATITITAINGNTGTLTATFNINALPGKWVKSANGKRWWYDNGDGTYPHNEFKVIGGKTYYFDANGYMATNWVKKDGKWYRFNSSGAMIKGWTKSSGKWYYLDPTTGVMQTGWLEKDGKTYYLNSSGAMATGWGKVGGDWYWFNSSGVMKTGWQKVGGKWYYLDPSTGAMKTGWFQQGSTWYYLKSSGAMATGWAKVGSNWYYFNSSGAMRTGWIKSSGNWFYLDSTGKMLTGWQTINGKKYYLDPNLGWIDGHKKEMSNKAQGYSSATGYLILVDISHCRVAVFTGYQGHWGIKYYWSCTCGASDTPTITGVYSTGYHLDSLPKWPNARYATNIVGGYFFHTTLSSTSELGHYYSHGCVRLAPENAIWIYYNIPQGTRVVLYW